MQSAETVLVPASDQDLPQDLVVDVRLDMSLQIGTTYSQMIERSRRQ